MATRTTIQELKYRFNIKLLRTNDICYLTCADHVSFVILLHPGARTFPTFSHVEVRVNAPFAEQAEWGEFWLDNSYIFVPLEVLANMIDRHGGIT